MGPSDAAPRSRRRRPPGGRLLLGLGLALALGAAAELGVRTYDLLTGHGFASGRWARSHRPVRPFRQFGEDLYVTRDGQRFISSCHGELYPFEKPAGTYRIVAFGGSTTHDVEAFEAAGIHYPLALQRRLRTDTGREDIEVINVGFSAYSSAHSLVLLALDVLSWQPDLLLLSHNVNDRSAAYFPDFQPDYANKYGHPSFLGPSADEIGLLDVLFRHSAAWGFLRDLQRHLGQAPIRYGDYEAAPPAEALAVFARNLRSFATLAHAQGIDVLFGSQPMHSDPRRSAQHLQFKPYNDIVLYPRPEIDLAHQRAYNAMLAQVAAETGSGFVDNATAMADVDAWFTDHVHYTPQGSEEIARLWAVAVLPYVEGRR